MIPQLLTQYGYYGFLSVGALSMVALTIWRRKLYNLTVLSSICYPLLLLVCGVLGAKLLYFVESGFVSFGGMSFFGSVYLVLLLMPLVGLMFKLTPLQSLDACAPCVASIIGFMRFGCYCAGCCGGIMCTVGERCFRWPTQLLEGFGDILILALLLYMEQKGKYQGVLYSVFLVFYGIMRFFIEFVRDTPKNMIGLSEGQWLALLGLLIGLVWWMISHRKKVSDERCA